MACDVVGLEEIFTHEVDGLLTPAKDPERLSEALLRLLLDPGLAARLGAAARQSVIERFSQAAMVRETLRVYETGAGAPEARPSLHTKEGRCHESCHANGLPSVSPRAEEPASFPSRSTATGWPVRLLRPRRPRPGPTGGPPSPKALRHSHPLPPPRLPRCLRRDDERVRGSAGSPGNCGASWASRWKDRCWPATAAPPPPRCGCLPGGSGSASGMRQEGPRLHRHVTGRVRQGIGA